MINECLKERKNLKEKPQKDSSLEEAVIGSQRSLQQEQPLHESCSTSNQYKRRRRLCSDRQEGNLKHDFLVCYCGRHFSFLVSWMDFTSLFLIAPLAAHLFPCLSILFRVELHVTSQSSCYVSKKHSDQKLKAWCYSLFFSFLCWKNKDSGNLSTLLLPSLAYYVALIP